MNVVNKVNPLALLMLAAVIVTNGCNQSPTASDLSDTTKTSLATHKAEDGCCGKCQEEQNAVTANQSERCVDCTACSQGDSSQCKCCESDQSEQVSVSIDKSTQKPEAGSTSTKPDVKTFAEDRDLFHFLLANNDKITRTVTNLKNGVETVTESDDPSIAAKIQEHVASMYQRVEDIRPIRMRDPLYRELFKYTKKIKMELNNTDNGIRVQESSDDEYVVKLIQAHAKVVSGFVEHGFKEARKNHQPPRRQ